ncbi:MAG TPA: fluoride efflux transporter CrcB [Candidatus Elarobacter sp.]
MNQWAALGAVAAGGAIGSVFRFLVGTWFLQRLGPGFPWGTLTINVTGSFLIGAVLQLAQTRMGLTPYARVFLATGILGGYTTFSTFSYETYLLSRDAFTVQSIWYGFGSVIAGVAAAYLGIVAVRALVA